jgi:hypothetical protein
LFNVVSPRLAKSLAKLLVSSTPLTIEFMKHLPTTTTEMAWGIYAMALRRSFWPIIYHRARNGRRLELQATLQSAKEGADVAQNTT